MKYRIKIGDYYLHMVSTNIEAISLTIMKDPAHATIVDESQIDLVASLLAKIDPIMMFEKEEITEEYKDS